MTTKLDDQEAPIPGIWPNTLQLGQVLGEGSFGKVLLGTDTKTNQQFAVKRLPKTIPPEDFMAEVAALKTLERLCKPSNGPAYFLCYAGFYADDNYYYILTDYKPGFLSLDKAIKIRPPFKMQKWLATVARNLLLGMKIMHDAGIVHRDVKPANILVHPVQGTIYYIDFGLACASRGKYLCQAAAVGSPVYSAPELWADDSETITFDKARRSDIWSLGLTLWEMFDATHEITFTAWENAQNIVERFLEPQRYFDRIAAQKENPQLAGLRFVKQFSEEFDYNGHNALTLRNAQVENAMRAAFDELPKSSTLAPTTAPGKTVSGVSGNQIGSLKPLLQRDPMKRSL